MSVGREIKTGVRRGVKGPSGQAAVLSRQGKSIDELRDSTVVSHCFASHAKQEAVMILGKVVGKD